MSAHKSWKGHVEARGIGHFRESSIFFCGAPYGYRYIRKSEHAPASYSIIDSEASVVRLVYELCTAKGLSIGAIYTITERTSSTNAQANLTVGALDRLGSAAQSRLQRHTPVSICSCYGRNPSRLLRSDCRPIKVTRLVGQLHRALSKAW